MPFAVGELIFVSPHQQLKDRHFLMSVSSILLLIFLFFLFSFYQYPPINLMFHGLLEIHIHQLRTGVLWSLQHFSDLFKGLVLNSCTGDKFLLPVAIQMCDISSRQAVACLQSWEQAGHVDGAFRSVIPLFLRSIYAQNPSNSSCKSAAGQISEQVWGCIPYPQDMWLHSWQLLGLLGVFSPWHFSSPVRANLKADQWAMGKWK